MNLREILVLLPLIGQLISLFGGKKAKKKARNMYPMILEAVNLWPTVAADLEALAETKPEVKRFKEILDQVVESIQ